MSNFFEELKTRNVYKAATAYAVTAWLILQVVDILGPNLGWPDNIGPLVTKILLVCFPIVLVITWLYEMTPEGLKRTGSIQQDTPDNRRTGKRLNTIIIATLAIAICLLLVERVFFAGNISINKRQQASIAVLPFVNMSAEEENEFFADGLTEQILDELAQLSGLQVTARTSSFKFKDKNEDIRKIAQELTVNYILEGSVQYDSRRNRIKITTQLINANNGYHLWSETYEDDFEEIFAIQENVSRKVVSKLHVALLPEEDKSLSGKLTENTEAYKLFLESRKYSQLREDASLAKGIGLLQKAIELEPDFAEAHAELAFLYHQRFFYGSLNKKIRDEKMKYHMEKALDLDPDKPEVLRAKSIYDVQLGQADSTERIKGLRKALKINPNYADGYYALSTALGSAGQFDGAIKALEKTVELDPLNMFYQSQYARALFFNRKQYEKGLEIANNQLSRNPDHGIAFLKAQMLESQPYGDLVGGFKIRHERLKKNPNDRRFLISTLNSAMGLDLEPYAAMLVRTIQMNYSDANILSRGVLFWYYYQQEYSKAGELIDYLSKENKIDPETATYERSWISLMLGDQSEALKIFEEGFPQIAYEKTSNEIDGSNSDYFVVYCELLKATGQHEKANLIADRLCEFYTNMKKIYPFMSDGDVHNHKLVCYYLTNKDEFLAYLDEVFFIKKERWGYFKDMKSGFNVLYEDDIEYQRLYNKIETETHRMRAKVIEYLKEEGEWDPSWDKELGLE